MIKNNNPLDFEPKNHNINVRVCKTRKEKFKDKCNRAGMSETQFLEKVCDCTIIFMDENVKKALKLMKEEI
ncbi:MAG TPA: hypothetical protein VMV95_02650 [Bacillota bacterium]|nr:hypothetical protein [Bacillota bacterium]